MVVLYILDCDVNVFPQWKLLRSIIFIQVYVEVQTDFFKKHYMLWVIIKVIVHALNLGNRRLNRGTTLNSINASFILNITRVVFSYQFHNKIGVCSRGNRKLPDFDNSIWSYFLTQWS